MLKRSARRRGFALVTTLSLMVLLVIVAVGLLEISAVALRSSNLGEDQTRARANARMALMLAIADLQKLAGPDQRVTATASVLQEKPTAPLPNNQWVGVWKTDGYKADPPSSPFITPDTSQGQGYADRRSHEPRHDLNRECLGWLVSGDPANPADPSATLPDADSIETCGQIGDSPAIRVPKITISAPGNSGAIAYHISDESAKIKLNLIDPYAPAQPDSAAPGAPAMNRWLAPHSHDASVFFANPSLSAAQAAKSISFKELECSSLLAGGNPTQQRQQLDLHRNDITTYSKSVLADPLHGGLKADLTAFLETGQTRPVGQSPAISDSSLINDELGNSRSHAGPKFGMLRNWYQLRNQITVSPNQHSIPTQIPNTTSTPNLRIVDPGDAFLKPVIQPVLAEAVYYLDHVLDAASQPNKIIELVYPRVVLWNPFAASLRTNGHVVFFDFSRSLGFTCTFKNPDGTDGQQNMSYDSSNNRQRMLGFYLPPATFQPGEALVFCAPARNMAFDDSNLRNNPLSAANSPADLGYFTRSWPNNSLPAAIDPSTVKLHYPQGSNVFWNFSAINGRTETITLHDVAGTGPVTGPALISSNGPPAVRQLSLDNYSRGNNGRWLPDYTKNHIDLLADAAQGLATPDTLLAYGGRLRFMYETYSNREHGASFNEPWFFSPLAHHNINAPNIHRWPDDNMFNLRYAVTGESTFGPHLYTYGPIAQARQWSPWLDTEVMPHRSSAGLFRTAVFSDASFATSASVYPVLDLPLPGMALTSLGALQHVPLSPFAWHPTHAIGNSTPSPFLPLANATSFTLSKESSLWNQKLAQFSSSINTDITGFNQLPDQVLLNDLSYEMNHALWDRFFLSTIPYASFKGDHWDLARPLPNATILINPILSHNGTRSELADFHRAARALWLDGGFNVHSTSIPAWKSLLRSFREIKVPATPAITTSNKSSAFPKPATPAGGPTTAALSPDRDDFWRNYRALSDDEIDALATEIVNQIRQRAPFCGLTDFINRRLTDSSDPQQLDHAYGGVIQAALNHISKINDSGTTVADLRMPTPAAAATYEYGASYWGGPAATPEPQTYNTYLTEQSAPTTRLKGADAASQITQADILQKIGSMLVVRGDTFVIRAYGESRDAHGHITARAWCEAVVQRTPEPITPDPDSEQLNPLIQSGHTDWGRKYQIESFRWLTAGET